MLTNNSVDLRVYEVIEEKLNNIIDQLGIDKTSDVLDSAIDMKKVNRLYLQSLLDPEKFEFAGEKWLNEIKRKLREYKSTEGILPKVAESEIDYKKAAEIKHSPLPIWLEDLTTQFTMLNGGSIHKNLLGFSEIKIQNEIKNITFDSEVALSNPGIEHVTLQHDWIRKILNDIAEFDSNNGIPILTSKGGEETAGYWSLWQITAKNKFENKVNYHCFFIADNGKQYSAYANDIWNRLIAGKMDFKIEQSQFTIETPNIHKQLNDLQYLVYQNLEADVLTNIKAKKENRANSYAYQQNRINKIGIENIRISKLAKLEKEHENWIKEFKSNQKIIPGIKELLTIRING
jgi:hypothetical protein